MKTSRYSFRPVYLALLLVSAFLPTVLAQEFRGTLTGQVSDPAGALVPGAQVEAVNQATHQAYKTTSTDKGVYFIPYVLPGAYKVSVTATGFKTAVQDNVVLEASSSRGLNFALQLGTTQETVEVSGAPPLIETANGSGGTVLSQQEIENLPATAVCRTTTLRTFQTNTSTGSPSLA
jgi:Carboxypeptidase regulatory-like domain